MTGCEICGSEKRIDQHHTSYENDETVPLCRSCHQNVHNDPSSEYHPEDAPETTTVEVSREIKDDLDSLKIVDSESYKGVVGRLLENHDEKAEVDEARARDIAREEINRMVTHRELE